MLRRDDPNHNRTVHIPVLQTPSDNNVCVIKMLLIVALRTGSIRGTTLDEMLKDTAKRSDKTIQWAHGTRPVIAQITAGGGPLLLDEPAAPAQVWATFSTAGVKAGIIAPIAPHDMRRGAARDITQLKSKGRQPRP